MEEARIFGVVGGTAADPEVAYLKSDATVTPEMLEQLGDLNPTHVFRFAARCEEGRCGQYKDGRCSLGQRIAQMLPPVTESLPSCQIRASCRWYEEVGAAACRRCPQVVTIVPSGQAELRQAATPEG
ncbi:MAG TPA: hypothetical protein VGB04_08925 [Allosphingosinicella sp.]|jgi:hypothetical protein